MKKLSHCCCLYLVIVCAYAQLWPYAAFHYYKYVRGAVISLRDADTSTALHSTRACGGSVPACPAPPFPHVPDEDAPGGSPFLEANVDADDLDIGTIFGTPLSPSEAVEWAAISVLWQ